MSIVIPTLNAAGDLGRCLAAIEAQDYPADRIEVLVLDGGSTDGTRALAEARGCRLWVDDDLSHRGTYLGSADARMARGVTQAANEIIAFVMADNWMPDARWLRQMVRPLIDDPHIVGSLTLRYGARPDGPLIERYFALIGIGDPVAYYLNKRDRISWGEETLPYNAESEDCGPYHRVRFRADGLPPLGCNGTLVRRDTLLRCDLTPERFGHSDAMQEMVERGDDTFAVVKNDITHVYTGSFRDEIRKRIGFLQVYSEQRPPRRYHMFDGRRPADVARLALYVLYSLTFVKPAWDALRGFRKRRDLAWFVHPFFCFAMTFAYGFSVLSRPFRGRRPTATRP